MSGGSARPVCSLRDERQGGRLVDFAVGGDEESSIGVVIMCWEDALDLAECREFFGEGRVVEHEEPRELLCRDLREFFGIRTGRK